MASQTAHKHHGLGFYFVILIALMALTLLTFFTARQWDGHIPTAARLPIALLIASIKAALVVWFFMHLGQHQDTNKVYFLTTVVLLTMLIGMVVADVATRLPTANPNFSTYKEKRGPW